MYEYVFSIRILTHYLDWDYTFNTYFNEYLYPRLEEDDSYLLLLGICNFNFYRIFGEIESTKMVNDLLKSKMEKVSTTSILSYLLIKQIDPLISSIWLEENTKELIDQGWSIEYLTKYLIF
ncbi:hypothetical protein NBO_97g0001 [Nosema bombycis CQ1]|uniref:Uncharacterized protein n=1 Tax=Nosema bombycis (strain CQ1 / CVCC 102059) TaxID=578461 RepID=R0KSP2_NOSB1|nr:hypothetical protein NBO_97g0001 [Nosema bombycis CQ1]|eukprot:EOB13237.1 hypothetical protein NBO_97g0001 [Nosema bombycis CQ1]